MTSFNILQPAATGVRTLLAIALSAGLAAFLAAFLLLPPRLNALINSLAAASPHSCLYYTQRPTPDGSRSRSPALSRSSRSRSSGPDLRVTTRRVFGKGSSDKASYTSGPTLGLNIYKERDRDQEKEREAEQAVSPAGPEEGPEKRALASGINAASMPRLQLVHRKLWCGQCRPTTRLGCSERAAATTGASGPSSVKRNCQGLSSHVVVDEKGLSNKGCGSGQFMTFDECMRKYGSVPSLRVLIMVAGTRGDVQPATTLGVRLSSHGHRVRLATHVSYRDMVSGAGLEFFPLAGDPRGMMELTVKHRGMLFGDLGDMIWLRRQYAEIMDSCWAACGAGMAGRGGGRVARGPGRTEHGFGSISGNGGAGDFQPDLIIATAITYGAVHCAEALDVPLHVISTIPWRPTQEICHPWARGFEDTLAGHCSALAAAVLPPPPAWAKDTRVGAAYGKVAARVRAAVVRSANWWSSCLLDHIAWLGIADLVAAFRRRLGLPLLSLRNTGFALYDLPTSFTFSPALLPPPRDWGPHVAVSGPLLLPEEHIRGLPTREAEGARSEAVATVTAPASTAVPTIASEAVVAATSACHLTQRDGSRETAIVQGSSSLGEHEGAIFVRGTAGWEADGAGEGSRAEATIAGDDSCIAMDCTSTGHATCPLAAASGEYVPPLDLVDFLEREPDRKPIYIGFGSVTLAEGRALALEIREAVAATGVRAVVSAGGWDCLGIAGGNGSSTGSVTSDILVVRDVPHTWLFPRCAAVIHHGGVGTTVAGLLAGCPTFVAPSFGDLFLWGELCGRAGVGPMPVPIYKLTRIDLHYAILVLLSEDARDAAKALGGRLRQTDGLAAAVQHMYRGLTVETSW